MRVCALFLLFLSGAAAQLSATNTSCVGMEVTYTCTVPALAHAWTIHTLPDPITTSITRGTTEDSEPPYSFQTVSDDGTVITSVTVTAFPELNGIVISCRDGNAPAGQADMQETTAMVFGLPTAPGLDVIAVDLRNFTFTITPPSVASQCVLNYTITPASSDGGVVTDTTVVVSDPEAPVTLSKDGFDLCNSTYNFTVVANTLTGPGERSGVVFPEGVDFLTPNITLQNSGFRVEITGMAPINTPSFADSKVSIQRSSPDSDTCTMNFIYQTTNGSSVTVVDTLSCGYARRRVTYCLQFNSDICESRVAMMSTVELPPLLSNGLEAVSPASNNISLIVDVNEQANCEGVEGLTITATVAEGARTISTQEANFADATITFESVPAGNYTCSVTVEDGTVPIQSIQTSCTATDAPGQDAPVVGAIVGGVVGGAAVLIIVVVVVVVLVLILVPKKSSDNVKATELKPTQTYQPVADDKPSGTAAAPTAMYADPRSIEHETTGAAGDEYALVAKPSKTKKKDNDMTDGAGVTGDMYSVPDKSKKQKNAGMVYADLSLNNPRRPPPPPAPAQTPRGIGSVYPADNEPVVYSTVQ